MLILKGPYLQYPTQNSIMIMWETTIPSSSQVRYWETKRIHSGMDGHFVTLKETEKSVEDKTLCEIHTITLTGLAPNTSYHYQVRSRESDGEVQESAEFPLKTAAAVVDPFSFAVSSEFGGYGDKAINQRLFTQMQRYRPEFLLIVGDAVPRGEHYEDWDKTLFGPGRALFANTPFFLCLGNHEQRSPWFYQFVSNPSPKNYYSFDYGNTHFIALDSTEVINYKPGDPTPYPSGAMFAPGTPQYDFLVNDLKSSQATWKIVFFHYPPYVSADYQVEEMRVLCPIFEEYGVDIVFNSHTIVYERSHPLRNNQLDLEHGVVYIVAGGAGAMPQWLHHKPAWHTAFSLAVPHFVQVNVAGRSLELRAVDDEGRLFDLLRLVKPA